jgi:PAS domain S-box-containing protein
MNISQIIFNSNSIKVALKDKALKKELDAILDFVVDICEVSDVFISLKTEGKNLILSKKGLKNFKTPTNISYFNELTRKQAILILSANNEACNYQLSGTKESFTFFAGFPLNPSTTLIAGSLCILKKRKQEISSTELKIIRQCVSQIESILDFSIKNTDLKIQLSEAKIQFEYFTENSNEIIYERALDGTITYVSKNVLASLGHNTHDIIGSSNTTLIHPEDLKKCSDFISALKLNKKNNETLIYRVLNKKGHYIWYSSKINLIEKNNQQFYIGHSTDITKFVENQKELQLQKEFYETILVHLPTDVAVFDCNHRYLYLNAKAIKNKALRQYIIGKEDFEYAKHTNRTNDFAIERRAKFNQASQKKGTLSWVEELDNALGEKSFHDRKFTPILNDQGKLEIMIGFSVDITESTKIKNEIIKNRQLINSILENVAVGILVIGPQLELIENNKAACTMLGLDQEQIQFIGNVSLKRYSEIIHEDGSSFPFEERPIPQAIKHLKAINNVVMGVRHHIADQVKWLLVDAIPVYGDGNQLLYVIGSLTDITAEKKIKDELKISNERFTYVNMATSNIIWDLDLKADSILLSNNYTRLLGHKLDNKHNLLKVQEYNKLIHPDDIERVLTKMNAALTSKVKTWNNEFRYLKSDGSYATLRDKAYIIRNHLNKAIRVIGAQTDITIKKKLEDELQKSEEKFKSAFEHSSLGIAFVSNDGYYTNVNNQFSTILGYSEKQLKTLHFSEITYSEDLPKEEYNIETLVSDERSFFQMEKRYIKKNNSIVWTNMFTSVVRNSNREIAYFIEKIIDITTTKMIEEQNKVLIEENNRNRNIQLYTAENLYRLLANNTIDLVCLHDLDMTFQYVSPSVKALIGYTPESMIGKTPMDYAHPKDINGMINDIYNFTSRNHTTPSEYRYISSTGKHIWLETIAKIVYENGVPLKIQTSTRDISIRKKADSIIETTLKRERELNQLRTNLVSTISHEFRTPMTTIRTSAELIEIYIEGQNSTNEQHLRKQINKITDEIDRIVELMNAVLIISKDDSGKTKFKPIAFDVKELCINIVETSFSNNHKGQKVDFSFKGDEFLIFADRNLIQYSIFNLLNNAFKYSENCQNIEMLIKSHEHEIQIEIIDFGIGIPKEDQPNLFNTFFRASNTDGIQGTGLGLYIVKTFVEKNSGKIKLKSQLGKGTKAILNLPKAEVII